MKALCKLFKRLLCDKPKQSVEISNLGDAVVIWGIEMEVCEISYGIDAINGNSARVTFRNRPKGQDMP